MSYFFMYIFHKILHYISFEVLKKQIWPDFQRIIELFAQKNVTKLSKVWVWDRGIKKVPDPGSGSTTLIFSIVDKANFSASLH